MENTEIIEKIAHLEEREKSNTKRIDKIECDIGEIKELTIAVKEIAMETKATREDVNDMNSRLKIVEQKPMQEYDETKRKVKEKIVSFVLGIVLMFIALKLGLKNYI